MAESADFARKCRFSGAGDIDYQTIVKLISNTKTQTGLMVHCELDLNEYKKGKKIKDKQLELVNIVRDEFHGDWNYTIWPSAMAEARD